MKTWILYVGAVLLGLASSLLLGSLASYQAVLQVLVPLMKEISLFILFPVVLILYTAGSASLLRHKNASILYLSTFLWALSTTLILTFLATLIVRVIPQSLILLPTAAAEGFHITKPTFESIKSLAVSDNAFSQLILTPTHLLPVIVLAIIAGYSIKPNYEAIRPAYVVTNSFSEATLRLSKFVSLLYAFVIMVLSAQFFSMTEMTSLLAGALPLAGVYIGLTLLFVFGILPLLFSLYTGFRKGSPYQIIFRGFAALLSSFFFQSTLESTPTIIALSEQNNRTKKRVTGTAVPLYTIIGKGGSALIASSTVAIILISSQVELSFSIILLLSLFSAFISLVSSFVVKAEVVFIMLAAYMGIGNTELTIPGAIIIMLPFIQGLSALINAVIALLGTAYTSRTISIDDPAEYTQTL